MGNRAQRVMEQVQKQEILDKRFLEELGGIEDQASMAKQGKYIKAILNELNTTKGTNACRNIMRPCGHQCISDNIIATAKSLFQKSDHDMVKFLEIMNSHHIGGGKLHMEDMSIIGIYDRCYCGIPKTVKNFPKEYCECSAGWYEKLFSDVFQKKVDVEIIQTISSGSDQCMFKVSF